MIRKMKHAVRWAAVGAVLAYVFDPEHGNGRREALRQHAVALVDLVKGSIGQRSGDAEPTWSSEPQASQAPTNGSAATPAGSTTAPAS